MTPRFLTELTISISPILEEMQFRPRSIWSSRVFEPKKMAWVLQGLRVREFSRQCKDFILKILQQNFNPV